MIEKYLADIERRIDPGVEEELFRQWQSFADGRFTGEIFSPKRSRVAPPAVEWPHVLVNDALEDFEAMALQQLEQGSNALAEGSGALLAVRCNYGTAILPSLFGGEVFLMDRELDTLPACRPLEGGSEAVKRLLDRGVPDLNAGQGAAVFAMGRYYQELLERYPKLSKYVHIYHPDLQGPMNVCEMLWGGSLYVDLYDQPDLIRDFLSLITETYIRFMRRWEEIVARPSSPVARGAGIPPSNRGQDARDTQGQDAFATKGNGVEARGAYGLRPPASSLQASERQATNDERRSYGVHWAMLHGGRIMVRDDAATNLSPAMFEEFVRPFDQRLFDELGGGGLHFCGRGEHFIAAATRMAGVYAVNTTQPYLNDLTTILRNTVDRNIQLLGFDREVAERAMAQGMSLHGNVHCW